MPGRSEMGFLLLGIDSLIACLAVGPIIRRRWAVPFAVLFGVADGLGFLLGSAFHWSVPDSVGTVVQTAILVALGCYWIAIAVFAGKAQVSSSRWLMWVMPLALSIDNITFGVVGDHAGSVLSQAGEQALASALLAGVGLAISVGVARAVPATRRHAPIANGVAGAALILASGALLLVG
jgi:hypothetical protein